MGTASPNPSDPLRRYHRQMILPGFGIHAQQCLSGSHAVLVGCGALGATIADQLARAGVGRLTIIDRDVVEWTNLHRQALFSEEDARLGTPKVIAAATRLLAVNSQIQIRPLAADLNPASAEHLCGDADVVIDGTDNFQTRYLLNDICVKLDLPLVYGGVVGTTGMTLTVIPGRTPCLRCIFPDPPGPGASPTCDTAGVLGTMAAVVASIQSTETIKVLLGRHDLLRQSLGQFDIWNNTRRTIDLAGLDRSACPCCTHRRFDFLESAPQGATAICGGDSVQILPGAAARLDLQSLTSRLAPHGEFVPSAFTIRGRLADRPDIGLTIFRDGRAIVHGTTDESLARSIYARYISA